MIPNILDHRGATPVRRGRDDVPIPLAADGTGRVRLEEYRGYVGVLVGQNFPAHLAARVEADDLVQDVLLKAWAADPNFSSRQEGECLAFLRKTCASVLTDTNRRFDRRKRKVSLERSLDDSSMRLEEWRAAVQSTPSQRASKHEVLLQLANALGSLPENQRRAVELRHLKRFPLAKTAELMDISPQASAALLRRGLSTLRERLGARSSPDQP
jgi:RNA polymerase sigma-70 factor (ECF subfamily)